MATINDFNIIHEQFTYKWEGGEKFVNDPSDPGGATKFGISLRFLKNLPLKTADINHDGKKTWHDIMLLDKNLSKNIFFEYFWKTICADKMPDTLAMVAYDTAVNIGTTRTIKMIQEIIGVSPDGVIGVKTLAAINKVDEMGSAKQLLKNRATYYLKLAANTEWADKFIKGWLNRTSALADFVGFPELFK